MTHRNSMRCRSAAAIGLLGLLVMAACAPEPVRWDVAQSRVAEVPARWVPDAAPDAGPVCASSLVASKARGDTAYAAWWAPRADSSAILLVARSDDRGHSWRTPEIADSTDKGRSGCARPPPFLATDSLNGYVHVAYFLVAPEGPGVFFTHSMAGGTMFHSPVPIVYGERVSVASVAAEGDTVAVAYENPNAATSQIWLALSHSTGHIFEERASVSSANVTATNPSVTLHDGRVAVSWTETGKRDGAGTVVGRSGTLMK
jgi:hypothetical protein